MGKQPSEQIQSAAQAVSTAVMVLKMEMPTIKAFLKECRDMENFGHIIDPTLYNKSERKALSAVLEPLFKAASAFVSEYEVHVAASHATLEKVARA